MKIEVGMKCEQIAVIEEYGFNYVGHEFEITKANNTVIMGRGLSTGVCFGIEKENFHNYFEIVKVEEDLINEQIITKDNIKVIRNGAATIVILSDGCKGVSKCLPEDKYDAERGYEIALVKAQIKSLNKKLKELTK